MAETDYIPRTPNQIQRFLSDAQYYVLIVRSRDLWSPLRDDWAAFHILNRARGEAVENPDLFCEECGALGGHDGEDGSVLCGACRTQLAIEASKDDWWADPGVSGARREL